MSNLPDGIQGARRPSLELTWVRGNGGTKPIPEDLTAATLTGFISAGNVTVPISGTLTVTDAVNGVFRWDMSAADVADAGYFRVQFVANYPSGQSPAKSFAASWTLQQALVATLP